jgi:NodT family efflux transporter outer membrane factor (OMF) lipoprotein
LNSLYKGIFTVMRRRGNMAHRIGQGFHGVHRTLAVLLLGAYLTTGCAVGPDYTRPEVPVMDQWIEEQNPALSRDASDMAQWWKRFSDPVLDVLMERACRENLNLRIAGIRILEARAQLGIVAGGSYPQLQQLSGGYSGTSLSKNDPNTTPQLDTHFATASIGFDAAWELDVWGRYRRSVETGVWNLEASIAGYDDILVSLMGEVARTYVLIRTLETRLVIARENVSLQDRSLQIARVRFEAGDVTELDVAQARSLLAETQASVPRLEARLRQAKNALALLLGLLPREIEPLLAEPRSIPAVPENVAVSVPAELLRRRPDIRLAESRMAAQSALIGVAKTDLYPRFGLFGSIGLSGSNAAVTAAGFPGGSTLSDLWDSDSLEYGGGFGFVWDIFNYGRIRNKIRVQDARFQQLLVGYRDTVLRAAQETEDALSAFLRSREEVVFLDESASAARRSVQLSLIQYREGLVDYQRVIDSQRFQARAEDVLTAVQGSVVVNLIAAYKALGGGWESRAVADFVPEETRREMRARTNWGDLLEPEEVEIVPEDHRLYWRFPDW